MLGYTKTIIKPTNIGDSDIIIYKNDDGERKMQFYVDYNANNNIYQSSYNIYDIDRFNLGYLNFVALCFLYVSMPNNILMVGLGGGHFPLFVKSKLENTNVDVIEINQQVLNGAIEMGYNLNNVIIMNGVDYIKNCNIVYNIIIIDLDDEKSFESFNFQDISNILKENGILAINSYSENKKLNLRDKIKIVFPLIKHYRYNGNNVLLCKKNTNELENMLDKITIEKLNQNYVFKHFKYNQHLLEILDLSKTSISL